MHPKGDFTFRCRIAHAGWRGKRMQTPLVSRNSVLSSQISEVSSSHYLQTLTPSLHCWHGIICFSRLWILLIMIHFHIHSLSAFYLVWSSLHRRVESAGNNILYLAVSVLYLYCIVILQLWTSARNFCTGVWTLVVARKTAAMRFIPAILWLYFTEEKYHVSSDFSPRSWGR